MCRGIEIVFHVCAESFEEERGMFYIPPPPPSVQQSYQSVGRGTCAVCRLRWFTRNIARGISELIVWCGLGIALFFFRTKFYETKTIA